MQRFSMALLAVLTPGLALSQGTGPGTIRASTNSGAFALSKLQNVGTRITQIQLVKLPNNVSGTWTAALTMAAVTTAYGGNGTKSGVVMGVYDQEKDTFTPNKMANALNSGPRIFGLMIEPFRGQIAVMDSPPRLATRTVFTQPFNAPKTFTNITSAPDPAVGYVGGKLKLFYFATLSSGQGLVMQDLDPSGPSVSGNAVLVAARPTTGRAHSPTPILGAGREVKGFLFAENVGSDSDMWFANDLDPKTPNLKVDDSSTWSNNGGVAGGQFLWAESCCYATGPKVTDVAWLLGETEKIGQPLDIVGAVFAKIPPPAVTLILISTGTGPALTIPGYNGKFALNLAGVVPFATMSHVNKTQRAQLAVPLPNNQALKGITAAIQGVSFVLGKGTFTNTAWVTIE